MELIKASVEASTDSVEAFMEAFMQVINDSMEKNDGSFHESFRQSFCGSSFHDGLGVRTRVRFRNIIAENFRGRMFTPV